MFVRNSLFTFLSRLYLFASSLAISIYVARVLGPEAKGVYALLMQFINLLSFLGALGIQSAVLYYLRSKQFSFEEAAGNGLLVCLISSAVLLSVLVAARPFVSAVLLQGVSPFLFSMALLAIPLLLLARLGTGLLLGRGWIGRYNLFEMLQATLGVICFGLLVVWKGGGLSGALKAYVIGLLLTVFLYGLQHRRGWWGIVSPSMKVTRRLLLYGTSMFLAHLFLLLNYRIDFFFSTILYRLKPSVTTRLPLGWWNSFSSFPMRWGRSSFQRSLA